MDSQGPALFGHFRPFLTKMQFVRGRNTQKTPILNQLVHLYWIWHALFARFLRKMAHLCSSIKRRFCCLTAKSLIFAAISKNLLMNINVSTIYTWVRNIWLWICFLNSDSTKNSRLSLSKLFHSFAILKATTSKAIERLYKTSSI